MSDVRTAEEKLKERVGKLDELTDLILDDLLAAARNKSLSSADRKLILDFLKGNGLNLDPNAIPQDVKSLLTTRVKPTDFEDDDKPALSIAR